MIELNSLLDIGHVVVLFKNALNSYTGFTIAGVSIFRDPSSGWLIRPIRIAGLRTISRWRNWRPVLPTR